jgi:molecular chaperone GrpE
LKPGEYVLTDSKRKKESSEIRKSDEGKAKGGPAAGAEAEELAEVAGEEMVVEELEGEALLEKLETEKEELNQKYLRLLAEFDNYKKRTSKQFDELTRLANERIISALLDVLDNFSRALDAGRNSGDVQGLLKGVELIQTHFQEVLKREGLVEIEAESKPFDPRYHEAVQHVTTDRLDGDMVIEEIQKGYMLSDKVIRPTKVAVSRKPEPGEAGKKRKEGS